MFEIKNLQSPSAKHFNTIYHTKKNTNQFTFKKMEYRQRQIHRLNAGNLCTFKDKSIFHCAQFGCYCFFFFKY